MRCWYRVRLPCAGRWMSRSTPRHLRRDVLEAQLLPPRTNPKGSPWCVGVMFLSFQLTRIRVRGCYLVLVLCGNVFFFQMLNYSHQSLSLWNPVNISNLFQLYISFPASIVSLMISKFLIHLSYNVPSNFCYFLLQLFLFIKCTNWCFRLRWFLSQLH